MHLDAGTLQGVHHTRKKLDLSEEGEHRRMLTEIVVKVSDEVVVGCELADTQVSGQQIVRHASPHWRCCVVLAGGIQNELERDEKRARAGSKASQVVRGGRSGVGVAGLA